MMYLPRLCEHCLNPTCTASCPSGAIYKREEDGIVLIDQEKCRGWRMCISGCPYKKVYYNWDTGKSEKCTFCYPRIESGQPTVCSETCVGRIRYLGVILYDADKIEAAASSERETDLYGAQLDVFLDPNDPEVIAAARRDGVPEDWIESAKISPIWKMAMEWKVAFPLHPEYRTLPMVWYIPPLSPIQNAAQAGQIAMSDQMPDVRSLRIPVQYLANMLTAGDEEPIVHALERMSAMRLYMRALTVDGVRDEGIAARVGMSGRRIVSPSPPHTASKTNMAPIFGADAGSPMATDVPRAVPARQPCSAARKRPFLFRRRHSDDGPHTQGAVADPELSDGRTSGRYARNRSRAGTRSTNSDIHTGFVADADRGPEAGRSLRPSRALCDAI
jgi:ferredoxin